MSRSPALVDPAEPIPPSTLINDVVVALGGLLHPSVTSLFRGAWFSAGLSAAVVHCVLMRPASERALAFEET